jgi:glycerol-3-phosphate acyltransferase PlsX
LNIVVDAMGGDHAPAAVVQGVVEAVSEFDAHIVLVGLQDQMEKELRKYSYPADKVSLIHAPEVIGMHEPATIGVRKKRHSSITQGLRKLKEPGYDAFISAGNTGAVVASATVHLGMLPGVERPGIGLVIPQLDGFAFMIDVGANTDPKPKHLLQSSLMAVVYTREILGVANPRVGLLNIGEEETKGTDFMKETHKMMSERLGSFVGNIEANGIFSGSCDCIICDGFAGNIVIKVSEHLMESATTLIRREIRKSPLAMLGAFLMRSKMHSIKKYADYSEYGGAPLLGVNGLVMICHGRSNPKAIKNAIRAAAREVEHNIMATMIKEISKK